MIAVAAAMLMRMLDTLLVIAPETGNYVLCCCALVARHIVNLA